MRCSNPACPCPDPKIGRYRKFCNVCRWAAGKSKGEDGADFEITVELPPPDAARAARLASDHEALKPGDLRGEYSAPDYDREKKQEYSESMGAMAGALRDLGTDPAKLAAFASLTAEQERRWLNKRLARSQSIGLARELLFARQFEQIASHIKWPVRVEGYAKRGKPTSEKARLVPLLLTDLHIGAQLPGDENPLAFDFTAAGRRLAHIAQQTAEFKTQYRNQTCLKVLLAGDIIEGFLGHASDLDNAPLPEQCNAAGFFLFHVLQHLAAAFPRVEVHCQTGNHGRDILRHPGRATGSKWKSYETMIYRFVRQQCRPLENVTFSIPKAPWEVIPLFDKNMLLIHGDTEVKLKSPSSAGGKAAWGAAINKMNGESTYGAQIDLLAAGHFHDPTVMYFMDNKIGVCNGALVPPNGYARAAGMGDGTCLQMLWESTPGYAFGDSRALYVGPKQDADASLDAIVPPFTWEC